MKIKGKELKISSGRSSSSNFVIGRETNADLNITTRTYKHISGSSPMTHRTGVNRKSWTLDGSFLLTSAMFINLYSLLQNGSVWLSFGSLDFQFQGLAIIRKISFRAASQGQISVSVSFQGAGKPII